MCAERAVMPDSALVPAPPSVAVAGYAENLVDALKLLGAFEDRDREAEAACGLQRPPGEEESSSLRI